MDMTYSISDTNTTITYQDLTVSNCDWMNWGRLRLDIFWIIINDDVSNVEWRKIKYWYDLMYDDIDEVYLFIR